jgi:hypothetical protein
MWWSGVFLIFFGHDNFNNESSYVAMLAKLLERLMRRPAPPPRPPAIVVRVERSERFVVLRSLFKRGRPPRMLFCKYMNEGCVSWFFPFFVCLCSLFAASQHTFFIFNAARILCFFSNDSSSCRFLNDPAVFGCRTATGLRERERERERDRRCALPPPFLGPSGFGATDCMMVKRSFNDILVVLFKCTLFSGVDIFLFMNLCFFIFFFKYFIKSYYCF